MAPKTQIEPTKCPLCEFNSKRITSVDKHITDVHQMQPKDAYDKTFGNKLCECGCGQETLFNNIKHGYSNMLKGHNANIYALYSKEDAEKISEKRKEKLRGQTSWAKGLTKETDDRIAERAKATAEGRKKAFDEGKIKIWSKGLTKETDPRLKSISESLKEGYENETYVPWAKGLTKKTDERVRQMALKNSITHMTKGIRDRLDAIKRLNIETIKSRIEENSTLSVIDIGDYKNDASQTIQVECTVCKQSFFSSLRRLQHGRCWNCDPNGNKAQTDIANYIELELKLNAKKNYRGLIKGDYKAAELDIFIEDKNFAIEYNGLYWHSDAYKSNSYHQNKSDQCEKNNITLMHIFQDEWNDKQEIIKSMIKYRVGLTSTKINARDCLIRQLTSSEKKKFFEENHIDSDTASTIAFGLISPSQVIVAALSLRKPFHKKYIDTIEVARMCSSLNTLVRGGTSKLINYVKTWAKNNGYKKIITYVDTRYGQNANSWINSGFVLIESTSPRFWWTNCNHRFNRFKYRADKARNMSEAQVAEEAGVVKIWGCKNLVFELNV